MDSVLQWGIDVVLWFQRLSPALDGVFGAITLLGNEEFFLLFLPLLYWCLDKHLGARTAVLLLSADYVNRGLKDLFQQPRPFQYDASVEMIGDAPGYGLPSGHTQGTTVFWGYLATQLRRGWMWALAAALVILVGLSRIYLGVHFPTDVLGGLVVGIACICLYLWLQPGATHWLTERGLGWQVGLALGIPIILLLVHGTDDSITSVAALMGMAVGFAIERRHVRFKTGGAVWRRALRFLLGAVVLLLLWWGLRSVFPAGPLFRTARYGLVGVWAGLGAPWAFTMVGLAGRE